MSTPLRVRRLSDDEGRQIQRIVRRGGGGTEKSIVKWRRALVVQAAAGGTTVSVIARLVATSEDRVREMIHRFNDVGMRSLDPQWAGGRPRQITTDDVTFIVATTTTRPEALGQPFTRWSIRKLIGYLADNSERIVKVGRERCRQILIAHDVTFQRTKTWKESNDPDRDVKLDRIEQNTSSTTTRSGVSRSMSSGRSHPPGRLEGVGEGIEPAASTSELSQASRGAAVPWLLLGRR